MKKAHKQECILLFMPCLDRGGAEKQFKMLRKKLIQQGQEVITILTSSDFLCCDEEIYGIKEKDSILLNEVEILKYILRIKQGKIIKCAIAYDAYAQFAIPILKILGIRTLFSERNSGEHKSRLSRKVISMADIITTNSHNAQKVMSTYVKKNIIYIPNGIDVPKLNRTCNIQMSNIINIIVPARIAPVKNQMFVIKSLEYEQNICVHFAGKVDDEIYFKLMMDYITDNHLNKRFVYDGFISDMNSYYDKFDIILLPSLSEGTSNVILEAFALKKLCIVSDIDMNKDVVPRSELLFRANDTQSLIDTINYFYHLDDKGINNVIDDCYNFVVSNYSANKMAERYWELIDGR